MVLFDNTPCLGGPYRMSVAPAATRRLEFLLLGGVLVFYVLVTILCNRPDLIWDEGRYLDYAQNLARGFYVTPEKPDLVNGPGYPLVLAPLVYIKAPLLAMRLLNAAFMALAVWFTFRAVLPYAGKRWALAIALITALHPSLIRTAPFLMTEALALACISGFVWAFTAALRASSWRFSIIVAAAFAFAWLIVTRVFFGNVLLATISLLLGLLAVWRSHRGLALRALTIMGLTFALCIPWLAFTKSKTGDTLCWSTNGGELLYWATSTNEGENGHWFSEEDAQNKPELVANGHREFYKDNYYLPVKMREAALKKKAFENIRANPKGVVKNWLCNWGRLIFGFPRSYHAEELLMLVLVVVNGPLLLAIVVALFLALRHWRTTPPEFLLLAAIIFIYLGGTSLLPGLPRYTVVIWPWLGLFTAGLLSRHLRVKSV